MEYQLDQIAQIVQHAEAASGTQLALIAAISSLLRNGDNTVDCLSERINITRSMIISSCGSVYKVNAFDSTAECLLAMVANQS